MTQAQVAVVPGTAPVRAVPGGVSRTLPARRTVMVIGGCGYVGHLLAPYQLVESMHYPGVGFSFDKRPCSDCAWKLLPGIRGDVTNLADLYFAAKGMGAIVYAAEGDVDDPHDLFDVAVHGVYNALLMARDRGVRRFILLSSLSVFSTGTGNIGGAPDFSEDAPPQCDHPDGVSVLNSEWLCRYFAETFGMSVIVLRISGPVADAKLLMDRAEMFARDPDDPVVFKTAASDLYRAIALAIELEGHTGFDVVNICGDLTGARVNLDKAKRLLGWEPTI